MNNESKQILNQLGFNTGENKITSRSPDSFGLQVTVVPRGTVSILFCNGGMEEYILLANHGALKRAKKDDEFGNEDDIREVNGVPYMSIPTTRLGNVFASIARMRLLFSKDKEKVRNHQKLSRQIARQWIAEMRKEENLFYLRALAQDDAVEAFESAMAGA